MVYIINRRSFGWTVHLEVAPALLLEALLLAVGTALAAGVVPAWRMAPHFAGARPARGVSARTHVL